MENPPAGQGPVLLDVGGEVGALLVRMPAAMEGIEIEIRSRPPGIPLAAHHAEELHDHGHDDPRNSRGTSDVTHVEALRRPTPVGVVTCAVFPSLLQGRYELYQRPSGPVRLEVTVAGGQVTEVSWPSVEAGGRASA